MEEKLQRIEKENSIRGVIDKIMKENGYKTSFVMFSDDETELVSFIEGSEKFLSIGLAGVLFEEMGLIGIFEKALMMVFMKSASEG